MITVVCWSWGAKFEPIYVLRLQAMLQLHLHLPYEFVCVSDDLASLELSGLERIRAVQMPSTYAHTPRCRRRMQQFSREFAASLGASRILSLDLDVVIVDDLTPLVDRPEPIVGWTVGHAGVYSGSFLLFDAGALHGAWEAYQRDPDGYPRKASPSGIGSDQAMVNHWLKTQRPIPCWTEADGFVTYYGAGYEDREHLGVGPHRPTLPPGARIVVLGSADKRVMDEGQFEWVRQFWGEPIRERVA